MSTTTATLAEITTRREARAIAYQNESADFYAISRRIKDDPERAIRVQGFAAECYATARRLIDGGDL